MAAVDFTIVLGVDAQHLWQLSVVLPTWRKHKPGLFEKEIVIFYDREEVKESDIKKVMDMECTAVPWPLEGVRYAGDPKCKRTNPQRNKMLSGFVHVPAMVVSTDYWLKLDTDTLATGCPSWIKGRWFDDSPSIVSHRWGFTRPPNQFEILDDWIEKNKHRVGMIGEKPPLNLHPEPDADRLRHPRIISWCSFFCTALTKYASQIALETCGRGQIPVPSQDGYMWYVAKRMGLRISTTNMKKLGWDHISLNRHLKQRAEKSMKGELA